MIAEDFGYFNQTQDSYESKHMKIIDIVIALICGKIVGFVISDFLKDLGIPLNLYQALALWLLFPLLALLGLWICYVIGKKLAFVFQAGKFFLVGAAATVADLKIFEVFIWIFGFFILINPLLAKTLSFLFATLLKYWGNKHWAFSKHGKEETIKELFQFLAITIIGLLIDVASFYYFTNIMGLRFGLPTILWVKLSVILAALVSAIWNFLGYKFLVFKK
ncbi:MAG: hypothetical protein A2908_03620 [Candidatus Staskawiczbacteria bacterium RIFCSPLOWO2_01_FULL_38_12b]|uniref:GtrA/DPMS transmembrane domain-containing protein n=1 Tax=Candidatus Staskawiczbacteria bacterium RIFCSPLOWO2_01_FULL_38_12b TaxID=1802214 RepID=A0A1G2ID15_9BACT|nr:MAG: hypothetical protein A2908_03620 [Candidatus Staskawiczbacteria bacterium RIFCSPLOWO2_01_FULL_38_12b]